MGIDSGRSHSWLSVVQPVGDYLVVLHNCTLMTSYISATLNALNRTRLNRNLSEERFYRATRKLDVLQSNYNTLFRWLWWAVEGICVTIFVFGFCGSVRNERTEAARQFFVSTLVLGGILTLWKGLGGVYETSREVQQELVSPPSFGRLQTPTNRLKLFN